MTVPEPACLLSAPLAAGVRAEVKYSRGLDPDYVNTSHQFRLQPGTKSYAAQYYKVYAARLTEMRPRVLAAARAELGSAVPVRSLAELKEEEDERREGNILVVGTVFKQQERKPNILAELSEEGGLEPEPRHTRYTSEEDFLLLEDETMRVRLEGEAVLPALLVNGVVMAAWGREATGGRFHADKIFFANTPGEGGAEGGTAGRLAIVGGLELGGTGAAWLPALQLAVDWMAGGLGGPGEQAELARLGRLVVAGDSLAGSTRDTKEQARARYLTAHTAAGSLDGVRQLDELLVQLAANVNCDLMPGGADPATAVLPQQPLHRVMFPLAGRLPSLNTVTNPYSLSAGGRAVLVVSGQTVSDILRNSELTGPLEAMERCLIWGHLAPTAPDTIGCYPYTEQDPHVLHTLPDIFVVANQAEHEEKRVEVCGHTVLLVTVPRFSISRSLVTIDLGSLSSQLVNFDTELDLAWLDQ